MNRFWLPGMLALVAGVFLAPHFISSSVADKTDAAKEPSLVLYSARKDDLIQPLLQRFTEKTGIKVELLSDESPKLIARIEMEGDNTPADALLTIDAANLMLAADKGLLAPITSKALEDAVPAEYHDPKGRWWALSKRARLIFYSKDKVKPEQLSTYEDLADPKWKGQVLTRSSSHAYTQSLLAAMIDAGGVEKAQAWANGMKDNLARDPQGGDSDQLKALAAGVGSVALSNSYYYAKLANSTVEEERNVASKVGIFFPNQHAGPNELNGVHVNISGAGIVSTSKRKADAQKLIEFLASPEAQRIYADVNFEYPVNPAVKPSEALAPLVGFKADDRSLSSLEAHYKEATRVTDKAGWK